MFKLNFKKGWQEALSTIKRFPLAYLAAVIATACFMIYAQMDYTSYYLSGANEWLIKLAFTGVFGFLLYYAMHLFVENKKLKKKKKLIGFGLVTAILVAIYFFQYGYYIDFGLGDTKTLTRTLVGIMVAYALALSLPFWGLKTKENAFWQYVLKLSIRIVQTLVVFGILFGGIAAVLGTITVLFDAYISEVVYIHIFFVLAGLLAPVYIMKDVYKSLATLSKVKGYPKFIETITHFVLIPLVYVYAGVILVYLIQTLALFEWPKYGVSELISGFLVVGLSTYMMNYPKAGKKDWGGFYNKYFFVIALLVSVALLLGIGVRIQAYGFTVNRYIIAVFGLFMILLSFWKLFAKKLDIRNIYYTAIVLALVGLYGPLSAFSATWYSQTQRLENELNLDEPSSSEVYSIVRTLGEVTYQNRLEAYLSEFAEDDFSIDEDSSSYSIADEFAVSVGVVDTGYASSAKYSDSSFFSVNVSEPIRQVDLEDFNHMLRFDYYMDSDVQTYIINEQKFDLSRDGSVIKLGGYFERDLTEFFELFADQAYHYLPAQDIEIRDQNYLIQFEYIDGISTEGGVEVDGMSGYILVK